MKCFANKRCSVFVPLAFLFLAVAIVALTAWAVNSYISKSYVKGFFYRTPSQLSADGITLVELEDWEEMRAHRLIWEYYQDNYPETVRDFVEMRLRQLEEIDRRPEYREELRLFLEHFEEAQLEAPLFSVPRQHYNADGVVAIVAQACMVYAETRMCPNGMIFFFFQGEGLELTLDRVLPKGEGYSIYESGPWGAYIRKMKPDDSEGWHPSLL